MEGGGHAEAGGLGRRRRSVGRRVRDPGRPVGHGRRTREVRTARYLCDRVTVVRPIGWPNPAGECWSVMQRVRRPSFGRQCLAVVCLRSASISIAAGVLWAYTYHVGRGVAFSNYPAGQLATNPPHTFFSSPSAVLARPHGSWPRHRTFRIFTPVLV